MNINERIDQIISRKVNEGITGNEYEKLVDYQRSLIPHVKNVDGLIKTLEDGRKLIGNLSAGKGGNLVRIPYNALEKDLKSAKENLEKLMSEIEGYI